MTGLRSCALAALIALLVPISGSAQDVSAPGPDLGIAPDADLLPYTPTGRGRLTVPVTINGSGPFAFFVDTGSERTVIARELADSLKLGPGPTQRIQSLTGASKVSTVIIPSLELSQRRVRKIAAPTFARANIGAAGMLGIDSLKAQHVVFDFAGRRMALSPSRKDGRYRSGDEIVVVARTRLGRLVLSDATAHGSRVLIILDTGSEVSIGNEALRQRLRRAGKLRETRPIQVVSITGAAIEADYTTIGRIEIGRLRLGDVSIAFGKVPLFDQLGLSKRPAIILGMDVLSQFDRVAVDFGRREVRFLLPDEAPA